MRIGIWCAYAETLAPSAGIGVFVHNLARGLGKIEGVKDIVLAVHAGDESVVGETVALGQGRFSTAAVQKLPRRFRWRVKWLRARQRRLCHRIAAGHDSVRLRSQLDSNEARLDQLYAAQQISMPPGVEACDVWLLPHVDVYRRLDAPTVVVVHDMVPLHFPGVIREKQLEAFRRHCQRLVDLATIVGTMSKTICQVDIVGLLGCSPEKVRIVPGAIPADFGTPLARDELVRRYPVAGRPYLLYPAGYRPYKNHRILVESLARLHAQGHTDLNLVFTGFAGMPQELAQQISAVGLTNQVHVLGVVERPELAGLYQQAAATVVPSLYEQGSYPVLEAIHWGCPAAASDIPALREYLEPLRGTVPLFDPHDPASIAATIQDMLDERSRLVGTQQAALKMLGRRTWEDVAAEWVEVFAAAMTSSPVAKP